MNRSLSRSEMLEVAKHLTAYSDDIDRVSMCSQTISRMEDDDDDVSIGGRSCRRWRNETIVSVVVPEKNRNNDNKERRKKRIFTPSIVEYVKVLSMLYAIITTIIGFIFPISEALTNNWLNTTYNAVFLSYQLIVATIFLIYLQIRLIFEKKRHRTKETTAANALATNPQLDSRSKASIFPYDDELTMPSTAAANTNNNHLLDLTDAPPSSDDRLRLPHSAIRLRNRMIDRVMSDDGVSLASGLSTPIEVRGRGGGGRGGAAGGSSMSLRMKQSVDFDQQTSDNDELSACQSVTWMDVSKFGSIFNHEGSSLFLKVGALLFSLGNIIYYSLEIENSWTQSEFCRSKHREGWTFIPRLIFVVVQTFFIFKGPDVQVRDGLPIIWFGMLHVVSTNICLWFRTVVREIMEEFLYYSLSHSTPDHQNMTLNASSSDDDNTSISSISSNSSEGSFSSSSFSSSSSSTSSDSTCENALLHAATRYLFPFILEYSLIAVGTVACVVRSIAQPTDSEGHLVNGLRNLIKVCSFQKNDDIINDDDGKTSATSSTSTDNRGRPILTKSHGGLFIGALLFAGIVVAIVLFYFHGSSVGESTAIYLIADLVVHSCLLIGCVVAFALLRPLAYVAKPLSSDDALLIIAMCGSALFEISIIIASSNVISDGHFKGYDEPLRLSASIVASVQTVVQSMLILCALRRYPSTDEQVARMPGRGTVAFLIVGNVSVWVLRTVLAKAVDMTTPTEFYGEVAWLLIINLNLPLLLFFRFHCSVCFADVWHVAYTPLQHKLRKMRRRHNAASSAAVMDLSEVTSRVPHICVISPSRSQSRANIQENQMDNTSLASYKSTDM